jgi:hypothetical protein
VNRDDAFAPTKLHDPIHAGTAGGEQVPFRGDQQGFEFSSAGRHQAADGSNLGVDVMAAEAMLYVGPEEELAIGGEGYAAHLRLSSWRKMGCLPDCPSGLDHFCDPGRER